MNICSMPAPYCIYKLTNIENGSVYIGSTDNIRRRYRNHFTTKKDLGGLFRELGKQRFCIEVIATANTKREALIIEEQSTLEARAIGSVYNTKDANKNYITNGRAENTATHKYCFKCRRTLLRSAFHKHSSKNDGLQPMCKEDAKKCRNMNKKD